MTIKVYVSGICGSQEVRKRQQRVLFILQTMPIDLEIIDVTEPGREDDLIFMQEEVKKHDKSVPLPPQIFNGNDYCGDYADFQLANDDDEVMRFLKLEKGVPKTENVESTKILMQNGDTQKNDNALANTEEVIDTTGEITNTTGALDNDVNAADSDVEMLNVASHEDDTNLNVKDENDTTLKPSNEEKAPFSAGESEEEESD